MALPTFELLMGLRPKKWPASSTKLVIKSLTACSALPFVFRFIKPAVRASFILRVFMIQLVSLGCVGYQYLLKKLQFGPWCCLQSFKALLKFSEKDKSRNNYRLLKSFTRLRPAVDVGFANFLSPLLLLAFHRFHNINTLSRKTVTKLAERSFLMDEWGLKRSRHVEQHVPTWTLL